MSQNSGERSGIHAAGEGMGGEGVTKIVEADVRQSRFLQQTFQPCIATGGMNRLFRLERVGEDPLGDGFLFALAQELCRAWRELDDSPACVGLRFTDLHVTGADAQCSADGEIYTQMRVCHMWEGAGKIRFGIYACSPEDSSFTAVFTDMKITECVWKAHDGQQPDKQ